jgi:hypothetical protein
VEGIFRVMGRKEGWTQFPDGNFIETNYGPDSITIRKVIDLATARGIGCVLTEIFGIDAAAAADAHAIAFDEPALLVLPDIAEARHKGVAAHQFLGRLAVARFGHGRDDVDA